MITIDARNVKVLEDFFDEQATRDQRGLFIKSYRKAVAPLVATAKTFAPRRTGKLAASIGTMELKTEIAILVGAMRPKGAHGHLNENGTVERQYRTKKGAIHRTGRMTVNNFFERAYNATEDQIFETTADEWYGQIRRAVDKANSKMQ
jgi:hypothetical protein